MYNPKNKAASCIILFAIFLIVAVATRGALRTFVQKKKVAITPSVVVTVPVVANDSYTLGNTKLFYAQNPQLAYADQYVTVYASEAGVKTEVIRQVPIDIAGGGMPQFKTTSQANIALLTMGSADSGGFLEESYYIDVNTKKFLEVRYTNGPTILVTGFDGVVATIQLAIADTCGKEEQRKSGQPAFIRDMTVNGKLQNALPQSQRVFCTGPIEIGAAYSPAPFFEWFALSKDMTKVFFTFSGDAGDMNVWKQTYYFDLNDKKVKPEVGGEARL